VVFSGPEEINKAKAKHILLGILSKESSQALHRIIIVLGGNMNHFARSEFEQFEVKVEIFPVRFQILLLIQKFILSITRHLD